MYNNNILNDFSLLTSPSTPLKIYLTDEAETCFRIFKWRRPFISCFLADSLFIIRGKNNPKTTKNKSKVK